MGSTAGWQVSEDCGTAGERGREGESTIGERRGGNWCRVGTRVSSVGLLPGFRFAASGVWCLVADGF